MKIAIWIIAIVELVRMTQNFIQIYLSAMSNKKYMQKATDEFVKSLQRDDKEFMEELLKEIQGE